MSSFSNSRPSHSSFTSSTSLEGRWKSEGLEEAWQTCLVLAAEVVAHLSPRGVGVSLQLGLKAQSVDSEALVSSSGSSTYEFVTSGK